MSITDITPDTARAMLDGIGRNAPLREAKACRYLLDAGFTVEGLTEITGRRACFIEWRIDLLKLNQRGQNTLDAGRLPWNLAWEIAMLSNASQNVMLRRWARGEFVTSQSAEEAAKALRKEEAEITD